MERVCLKAYSLLTLNRPKSRPHERSTSTGLRYISSNLIGFKKYLQIIFLDEAYEMLPVVEVVVSSAILRAKRESMSVGGSGTKNRVAHGME